MVAATGNIEDRLSTLEYRGYDSHVGKVSAASHRMIGEDDLPVLPVLSHQLHLIPNCLLHGAQMHGEMRGIGHQITFGVKKCTGEI